MLSPAIPITAVDLSRLPSPVVVETLSYQAILDEMLADLVARDASFSALVESDPAMRVLEVAAYRETLARQQFNDRLKGLMVAYAIGPDLDQLGALVGCVRIELVPADPMTGGEVVMEEDLAYRRRIVLAPDGFSVAGPEAAYVYHALSAHPDVLDATAISPAPGEVLITVQSRIGDGSASSAVLEAVDAALNAETVRPLTDQVHVQSATAVGFQVQARLYVYSGPDSSLVRAASALRLDTYLSANRRLGRDVTRSSLYAALHAEGVQRVELLKPVADVVIDRVHVAVCFASDVTVYSAGE